MLDGLAFLLARFRKNFLPFLGQCEDLGPRVPSSGPTGAAFGAGTDPDSRPVAPSRSRSRPRPLGSGRRMRPTSLVAGGGGPAVSGGTSPSPRSWTGAWSRNPLSSGIAGASYALHSPRGAGPRTWQCNYSRHIMRTERNRRARPVSDVQSSRSRRSARPGRAGRVE